MNLGEVGAKLFQITMLLEDVKQQNDELKGENSVLKEKLSRMIGLFTDIMTERPKVQKNEMLRVNEAAEYLGIKVPTVYKLKGEGAIKAYKTGKILRFKKEDLDEYLLSKTSKTDAELSQDADEYFLRTKK